MNKIYITILLCFGFLFGQSDLGVTDGQLKMQNAVIDFEDGVTRALMTVDYPHHEIHESNHFNLGLSLSLGNTDTAHVVFDVGDTTKYSHMIWTISSTVGATITIYEGGEYVRMPDGIVSNNNDRNSDVTDVMDTIFIVYNDSTLATRLGTILATHTLGANQKSGGLLGRDNEWILKNDSLLDFRILSNAGSNIVDFDFEWYEHTSNE